MINSSALGLIATKIVPPTIPGSYLRRTRLEDRLEAGVVGPVTVVTAGAGSGKTLMVASWAEHRRSGMAGSGASVAWLALDGDDNEPSVFWSGVIAAVRASGAVAADNPLDQLAIEQGMTAQGMRTLRHGLANLPPGVVLVLDDFQVIDDPEILESVAVLLRHESPLRLVLITRSDPVLPLHRLRVSGGLCEIRSADLAFEYPEADEFFRLNGNALPPGDIHRLIERTEGWAAGLRLAAMFLTRNSTAELDGFTGDDRAVAEYLLAEVFASQPPAMRDFLLHTSISERISGELADVLTRGTHGQRHLERLEQANAFITSVGPHRQWYRYHPLLRETLLHQLRLEDPQLSDELHRRAAIWFAEHAAPVQAMRHAAHAQDWVLMGELFVTTAGPRIMSADRQAINESLALIPDAELARTAALQTCAAARLEYASRFAEIVPVVARAQRALAAESSGPIPAAYQAATTALIGLWVTAIARPTGDMTMLLETCRTVLHRLEHTDEPFPAADQYRTVALANQGIGLVWTGQADAAEPVLHRARETAVAADMEYTEMGSMGQLGLAAVIKGQLAQAQDWATKGLVLAEQRGWTGLTNAAASYLALGMVHVLQGRPAEAEPLLRQGTLASRESLTSIAMMIAQTRVDIMLNRPLSALRSARTAREKIQALRNPPVFVDRWLAVAEADVNLAAGNPSAVTAALSPTATPDHHSGEWATQRSLRLARAWMDLGQLADAEEVLQDLPADAENPLTAVEIALTTALLADRRREDVKARDAIERAVALAAPQGLCLPFITFDRNRVPRLFSRVVTSDPVQKSFLTQLDRLSFPTGRPTAEPEPLAEQLTDREMGVLRLLPSMLSNNEIADELFISVNTVKVHLKTLYRKLDAPNRRTAVRRGQALRLIS